MIENEFAFVFCRDAVWSHGPTVDVSFAASVQLSVAIDVFCEAYRHANCQCVDAGQMSRVLVVPSEPRHEFVVQCGAAEVAIFVVQGDVLGVAPRELNVSLFGEFSCSEIRGEVSWYVEGVQSGCVGVGFRFQRWG